jgi:hypothetical protein
LGGSDPRVAISALHWPLDLSLLPIGSLYCNLNDLDTADSDSAPLRGSGSSNAALSIKTAEELIVPTVRMIENDLFPGATANPTKSRIYDQIRELIEELNIPTPSDSVEPSEQPEPSDSGLFIVPALGEGDEVVGRILARLLEGEGIGSNLLSWRTLHTEKVERLKESEARYIVLSAIGSKSATAVGQMARSVQISVPDSLIAVGLWSLPSEGAARLIRKIKVSVVGGVYTNLEQAVRGISSLVSPSQQEVRPEPPARSSLNLT